MSEKSIASTFDEVLVKEYLKESKKMHSFWVGNKELA